MPKILPRGERAQCPVVEDTGFLPDVLAKISADVKGLQKLVEEVDEEPLTASLQEVSSPQHSRGRHTRQRQTSPPCTPAFDLAEVLARLDTFVTESDDRLELEPLPKSQRKQVAALANLYALEARACGRAGQTFFKTLNTKPLSSEDQIQAKRLLACSFRPPQSKKARTALRQQTRSALPVPVPESNIGNQLLRGLGWQEGQGLGASQSGIVEPLLPERRTGRQGLGC
ncbi:hypothetical protein WJX74_002903 [Apatococcus lobatus]|uniref:G-patch domain-containing protein n=1 Tax=Apatococcus lobatus TaxID=904363 RepID=A0AAW1S253_9CHLO